MARINLITPLFSLFISLSLIGCSETPPIDSGAVSTSNIYADIHLTTSDDRLAYIEVQLKNGGANSDQEIRLTGNDSLSATTIEDLNKVSIHGDLFSNIEALAADYKFLTEKNNAVGLLGLDFISPSLTWYSEALSIVDNNTITIAFNRPSENFVSAPDSKATFPTIFEITAPIKGGDALYSRSMDDILISWSPTVTSDFINIKAETQCSGDRHNTRWAANNIADNGSHTIPATSLESSLTTGHCPILITVAKVNLGTIDPNYGLGGYMTAQQSRSVIISSTD